MRCVARLSSQPGLRRLSSVINFMELKGRVEKLVSRTRIYKGSVFENIGLKGDFLSVLGGEIFCMLHVA